MRLPEVPPTYSTDVERERNRTLELAANDYITENDDLAFGLIVTTQSGAYTAVSTNYILADTSGGAFTITLPEAPSSGDYVIIADDGGNWETNNLTVGRNGETIEGAAEDLVCDVASVHVHLAYNGTTWRVYA